MIKTDQSVNSENQKEAHKLANEMRNNSLQSLFSGPSNLTEREIRLVTHAHAVGFWEALTRADEIADALHDEKIKETL